MTDEIQFIIERLLKVSFEQQSALLRYFSRSDIVTRIKILAEKTNRFHKLRQENGNSDKSILEYCALITAIKNAHDENESLRKKSFRGLKLEEIRILSQKKADQFIRKIKKPDPTREKLLGYWAIVRMLKLEQDFSFRQISLYLKKYHRFDVAHSTIFQLWNELEKNENTGESK
ncbi:hypothetical protein E0765_03330 [Sulfuricurvum sp. IAE1]|uniref:hypothetical protein n=1 Tax=Sulfuricurvum sp. IAE1 TaxID=2546102 RepID=UPI001045B15B|nr:hypothetical protein [Sulfuricurvum sp. IAE1]TDA68379.1 hypothetical protein E0765_03330 [Sulfuricurvum sp. IAE1]